MMQGMSLPIMEAMLNTQQLSFVTIGIVIHLEFWC